MALRRAARPSPTAPLRRVGPDCSSSRARCVRWGLLCIGGSATQGCINGGGIVGSGRRGVRGNRGLGERLNPGCWVGCQIPAGREQGRSRQRVGSRYAVSVGELELSTLSRRSIFRKAARRPNANAPRFASSKQPLTATGTRPREDWIICPQIGSPEGQRVSCSLLLTRLLVKSWLVMTPVFGSVS